MPAFHLPVLRPPKGMWIFEIGNPVFKGALLVKKNHAYIVQEIILQDIPANEKSDFLRNAFAEIAKNHKVKYPVWLAIARNIVTVRDLELPSVNPAELAAMADLQIGEHAPYNREEVITHWKLLPNTRPGFSRLLLAIAHQTLLTHYFGALNQSAFEIERVGLSSSGLGAFLKKSAPVEVVLDVGHSNSEFQLWAIPPKAAPFLLFARSIPVGSVRLAENRFETHEELLVELLRSVEILKSEEMIQTMPEQMLVLGAIDHSEVLVEHLEKTLGMTCVLAPPVTQTVKFSEQARVTWEQTRTSHSFNALLGMPLLAASQHFDLMPPAVKVQKSLERWTREIFRLGLLTTFLILSLSMIFLGRIYRKSYVLSELDQAYNETLQPAMETENMRRTVNTVQEWSLPENSAISFLETIHNITPTSLYYLQVNFENRKSFSLKGYAQTMAAIFEFVTRIDQLNRFSNVETKYATKRQIKDKEMVEFEITANLDKKTIRTGANVPGRIPG